MHGGQVHVAAGNADVAVGEASLGEAEAAAAGTLVAVAIEVEAPAKKRTAAQVRADNVATKKLKAKKG